MRVRDATARCECAMRLRDATARCDCAMHPELPDKDCRREGTHVCCRGNAARHDHSHRIERECVVNREDGGSKVLDDPLQQQQYVQLLRV
jgi:hypothetical protein